MFFSFYNYNTVIVGNEDRVLRTDDIYIAPTIVDYAIAVFLRIFCSNVKLVAVSDDIAGSTIIFREKDSFIVRIIINVETITNIKFVYC